MTGLYPLKFEPGLKERVWGGNFLQTEFKKNAEPGKKIGESWEISGVQGDVSVVSNGFLAGNTLEEIIEVYMGDLVGEQVYDKFGNEFPLLIKFIDAREDLSVQVHPGDSLARERHRAYGKTEMWYIIEAGEDARIYSGFKKDTEKAEYQESVADSSLPELLNSDLAQKGDVFFIPAGRVHAIGAGVVLAEIQQTSDVTYRIYDWGRTGLDGLPRELHTDLALDAIDFKASHNRIIRKTPDLNSEEKLVECNYFTCALLNLDSPAERSYVNLDSFVIYICTEGSFTISGQGESTEVSKGETVLIPASNEIVKIETGGAKILEVYIEDSKL